jgi:16S rRNA (adenine1518-N6/adenine1519-N6)-dimethyltransferase
MVRQSLKSTGVPVEGLLAAAGLAGNERAEELPVEAFLTMAKALRAARAAAPTPVPSPQGGGEPD